VTLSSYDQIEPVGRYYYFDLGKEGFFFGKGRCIFGLDPVSDGSEETCRRFSRFANSCLSSIQK
jgi:hypothetical protein